MDLNTDGRDVQPQISNDHSNDIQESNLPNPIKIPKIDAEQKEEVSTSTTSNPKQKYYQDNFPRFLDWF